MKTLLLVDDEASLLRVMERRLELAGYRVHSAPDGEAALDVINNVAVDAVLTDLRMPGMSGIELLRRIRDIRPQVPVALLTAYSSDETRAEAMEAGASAFLTKPVRDTELFECMRQVLAA
ncbi:MAG: response regulator [Acidobacteria bacterium]|nr:response regulator [Acidobacteriota bacterium]